MAERSITRADLIEAISLESGLSRHDAAGILEQLLDEISETLAKGEDVKLPSFASFSVRSKRERIGRNPKTGEEKMIPPLRVLKFRASHMLKSRINDPTAK